MSCLIVFHSLTHAQTAAAVLRRTGIPAELVKPPLSLGRGSCAHGLLLENRCLPGAMELLWKTSKKPLGIYEKTSGNSWKEIMM